MLNILKNDDTNPVMATSDCLKYNNKHSGLYLDPYLNCNILFIFSGSNYLSQVRITS